VLQYVQGSNFVYRYEVTLPEGTDISSGADNSNGDLSRYTGAFTEIIHDEMAETLLTCDGYDYDAVWILQSKPHVVDDSTPCGGSDSAATEGETPNDADSNDSGNCLVMVAEARIIAYQSPLGKKTSKQLWADSTFGEGETASSFALEAVTFVETGLRDGGLSLGQGVETTFLGGEIVSGEEESEDEDDGSTDSDSEDGDSNSADPPPNTGGGDGGPAAGIEGPNNGTIGGGRLGGFTPAIIATITVLGCCLLVILMLAALRRRRNNGVSRDDEEYLQDIGSPRSDGHHRYSMGGPVDHLDLSDSSDGGSRGPIIRTDLDMENYGQSKKSLRTLSPQHFHFSGFASLVTSPSSRERSKMGPLGQADEFNEQRSDSDKVSHRGIVTNSSSMSSNHRGIATNSSSSSNHRGITTNSSSSSNHRGIVSNSSSMSSNLPPPSQNSSPRLYQLRDTVKL